MRAALLDVLTQYTVIDALVSVLKDHEGYKQHLNACIAPVTEWISAKYSVNVHQAVISAQRNESVVE